MHRVSNFFFWIFYFLILFIYKISHQYILEKQSKTGLEGKDLVENKSNQ